MCCLRSITDMVVRTSIHPPHPTPPQRNPSNVSHGELCTVVQLPTLTYFCSFARSHQRPSKMLSAEHVAKHPPQGPSSSQSLCEINPWMVCRFADTPLGTSVMLSYMRLWKLFMFLFEAVTTYSSHLENIRKIQ